MAIRRDEMISEPRVVICDPDVCGGAPILEGTRIRVSDVVVAYDHWELSPEEIVLEFPSLALQDVHAALAYYHAHPQEIRAEVQARTDAFDAAG